MEIPGIGAVSKGDDAGCYYSQPIPIGVLGNKVCRMMIENYDEDPGKDEIHAAINNFLSIDQAVLKEAESYVFQYYLDCNDQWMSGEFDYPDIESSGDVWSFVQLGDEPIVSRRVYGDKGVYVSLECNCDWEVEHGLQIVFRSGLKVNKVGPYDGHLTNSDAYDDDSLENVVYR